MKRREISRRACLFASAAIALAPATARAELVVVDPTNLAQNILQVAHAVQQINNQIQQIEQARQTFQSASEISFEVSRVAEDLRDLYPESFEGFDLEATLARSDQWLAESRASLERSMAAEARAAAAVARADGDIDAALSASANAEGQTGAAQAGNQLLGLIATQLAETQSLLAAQGRALATERLERIAREERASEIRRRAFPTRRRDVEPARSAF
jgi:P-type conjugative transfer protein TrbJ